MTSTLVLTAKEGSSLTPAIQMLYNDFPHIYQKLEPIMSVEERPSLMVGSGAVDFARIEIELNVSPDVMEKIRPFFDLLLRLLERTTRQDITAKILIEENNVVNEYELGEDEGDNDDDEADDEKK